MHQQSVFLEPGTFVDSDHPAVVEFAWRAAAGAGDATQQAVRLYRAVRDDIAYDPYLDLHQPDTYRASGVLAAGKGFCVGKAALLAACARSLGIPARVGYADVRNHMTSARLRERMQSDVFVWHSYTELHLAGLWVKATPAFDARVCERAGILPLEFDGKSDSLFQPYSPDGRRHMEYLRDRGAFADVPLAAILADFRACYPSFAGQGRIEGTFADEVESANRA